MLCDIWHQLHVNLHQPLQDALVQFRPAHLHAFHIPDNKWQQILKSKHCLLNRDCCSPNFVEALQGKLH